MARLAANEEARIVKLRAALDRAVANGLVAETLKFKPMCELLGVSRSAMQDWCNEPEVAGSGAFIAGAKGIEYQFNVMATIWVLIRFWERKRDERHRVNMRIREAVAGDSLGDTPSGMSLSDVNQATQIHLRLRESEKEDGTLARAADVQATMNKMVLAFREATLSAPQKLDPTNEWSPEFREQIDNVLAELMGLLRHAGLDALSPDDGPVPAGSDGKGQRAEKRTPVRRSRSGGPKRAGTAATA
jgi:hypothetical protein